MSIMTQEAKKDLGCVLHWTGGPSSANSPKSISANGDVKQILPFPGAGIGMFDGNGGYLKVNSTSFNFGTTSPFTIEFLVMFNTVASHQTLVNTYDGTDGWQIEWLTSNQLQFYSPPDSAVFVSWTPVVNTWYHVAIARTSGAPVVYINGISAGTLSTNLNFDADGNNLSIGSSRVDSASVVLNGNLSELRISSVARYTSNFTPSRRQLESDSNTKLLIHFNRNDTTFIDSSPSAHTITAYGNAKQLCSPCGSGVAYFDGTGDYLTIADSDDWYMSGDYTISFYIKRNTINVEEPLIGQCISSNNGNPRNIIHILSNNKLWYYDYTASKQLVSTISIEDMNWHHIELIRESGILYWYIDGEQCGSLSYPTPTNNTNILYIGYGRISTGVGYYFNGYMSEILIKKNVALHTTNFIPPTQPFAPDPYTKLLLHMDGVGNAFYDSSDPPGDNGFPILPDGVTVTPSGTFTTQKMKDGRNYWKFDGSTNYITISDHAAWSMFLNDFTIAAWVKFDSVAANRTIIGQYTDANNQWYIRWTTSNVIELYGITSSTARFNFSCPLTPVAGTWYHVVVQRSGSSCIMYINGVAQTVTQTTAFSATATDIAAVLSIGNINTEYQVGNTKDLQIFHKALTMDQISALMAETYIY